jgi:dTDP-4-dehydrorhamnose reductase
MKILLSTANGQVGRALQMALTHHQVARCSITRRRTMFVAWLGMPSVWLSDHLFPVLEASLRRPPE